MSLPSDLERLLPQALDVIRFLGLQEDGSAPVDAIIAGTGLSERTGGKAIRRLVTRYYLDMPEQGYYRLTESGWRAVQDLRTFDGEFPPADLPAEEVEDQQEESDDLPAPAQPVRQARRLSMFLPKELVIRSTTILRAGFDAPAAGEPPLRLPGRVILRLNALGCEIDPVDRPLEVAVSAAAGPVRFRVTPGREGAMRFRLEAFQLMGQQSVLPVGGMVFDLNVAGFPTPASAEFHALGAVVYLYPGGAG